MLLQPPPPALGWPAGALALGSITSGQLIKGYGDREMRQVSSLAGEASDVSAIFKAF